MEWTGRYHSDRLFQQENGSLKTLFCFETFKYNFPLAPFPGSCSCTFNSVGSNTTGNGTSVASLFIPDFYWHFVRIQQVPDFHIICFRESLYFRKARIDPKKSEEIMAGNFVFGNWNGSCSFINKNKCAAHFPFARISYLFLFGYWFREQKTYFQTSGNFIPENLSHFFHLVCFHHSFASTSNQWRNY